MKPRLLHHVIRNIADSTPEHPAFRYLDQELSYGALADKAARLTNVLTDLGVQPGDRVGIYMDKGLETAVSVFGIMWAGAAFVPINPASPIARVQSVIRHCGIRTIVTVPAKEKSLHAVTGDQTPLRSIFGLSAQAEIDGVTCMDWSALETADPKTDARITSQDLAYVMYTSGSTGEPKGIIHTHSSGLAYAQMSSTLYELTSKDRLANLSPLHFDMSTFEYFAGPYSGACSLLIPETYVKLPASLGDLIAKERATTWYSVPFPLVQLLRNGAIGTHDLSALRWVIFGGEPFPIKDLRDLMHALPHARFSNSYGPAEVNQCAYYHLTSAPSETADSIPIGEICKGAEALIVDENDKPVPPGETGELLVRAPTQMRGYWNAPERVNSAFYDRAICPGVSDRFYRTGDLVRMDAQGNIDFIGRKDRQIKLRGFRIELDEIEAVLNELQQVSEAAAFPGPEGKTLIAAVCLNTLMPTKDLLKHCKARLQPYAVPAEIRIFEKFPRTGTDKIDRKKLQELVNSGDTSHRLKG